MILILDDHPLVRQGLSSLIQLYQKDRVIVHASTIKEAVTLMEKHMIRLVFLDLNLGKENGFTFLRWLKENHDDTKIFVVTSSSRQGDFQRAQELGVDAYVLKDAFVDEIMHGLKMVERGGKFFSAALVEQLSRLSEDEKALSSLTEREREVLLLLGQGYDNAKISKTLFIAEGTSKKHINSILSKLQLQNRVEAVLFANKNNYIIRLALDNGVKLDLRKEGAAT